MKTQIDRTENKNIIKFSSEDPLTEGSHSFLTLDQAESSPFAKQLLQFPFIKEVYISPFFIAIEKTDLVEWEDVLEDLKEMVDDAVINGKLFSNNKPKSYSIYVEMTPNPRVMKFVSNNVLTENNIEVKTREEAINIPILNSLYNQFSFIQEIFISENYLSITKDTSVEWEEVNMEIREYLFNYLQGGGEIIGDYKIQPAQAKQNREYSDVETKIKEILEEYVKPSVASDGGNIELIEYNSENKTAYMILYGACSGCPSSTATLKNGIQGLLGEMMPGIVENVESVNG
ncbi:MAG: NifU family protein [Solirubrobacteraceae bacterium]